MNGKRNSVKTPDWHRLAVEARTEWRGTGNEEEREILAARRVDDRAREMADWVMGLVPEWQAFATLTFPWEAGLQSTINSYERFMRKELPKVNTFYAVEQNPSRGGHHVHAIWSQSGDISRKDAWQKWFDRYGRARIEPVRHRQNVVDYCAKYIIKDEDWFNVKIVDRHLLRCIQEGLKPEFEQPTLLASNGSTRREARTIRGEGAKPRGGVPPHPLTGVKSNTNESAPGCRPVVDSSRLVGI